MRIAVPVKGDIISSHFGHCDYFSFFSVDTITKQIYSRQDISPPPHEPGVLPVWLKKQGADMVIASAMGMNARVLLEKQGIPVITGAQAFTPEILVELYLEENLEVEENPCDH